MGYIFYKLILLHLYVRPRHLESAPATMLMGSTGRPLLVADDIEQQKSALGSQQQRIEELMRRLCAGLTPGRLLVMCAHCRKIRDEDGCWRDDIEHLKPNAVVSHTVCPDCWPLFYPTSPLPQ